jgi:hypothetical protein
MLDPFSPSRGIRQGDPLSPYLFLFVADGLSCLIRKEIENNSLHEFHICRRAPGISHLLFADDSLLFFEGSIEQGLVVKSILDKYEQSTGQLVSLGKCSIMYGDQCSDEVQDELKRILKYETSCFEEKYLGLPVPEGRTKKGKFKPTKEKFQKHASDWSEKYMSSGAKEILIKSVLQSISTYAMGVFKFPSGLIEELSHIIRNFWWGDEENRRRMHWMSWERMARPKAQGGAGFRDLSVFNQALLARQAWRIIQHPDSLCARLLKARYFPSGDLLDTAFIQNQSQSWQGVVHGLELLKRGVIWRIGSGSKVKIFRDNWLPRIGAMKVEGRRNNSRKKWVSELIDANTNTWDVNEVRGCCAARDAEAILSIKLPVRASEDFVAWSAESNGIFSVRSAYRLGLQPTIDALAQGQSSSEASGDRSIWDLVWKAEFPQKIRVFAWKAATSTLAVRTGLHRRIPSTDPICTICGREREDDHHALVRCTLARALREEVRKFWRLPPEEVFQVSGKEWLLYLLSNTMREDRPKLLFLLWRVWHHRNNVVFGDGKASIVASATFINSYHNSYMATRHPNSSIPNGSAGSLGFPSWTAPVEGSLKANVDAGWDDLSKKAGLGIVIRDHSGGVILTEWKSVSSCASAEEAEVLAILSGIKHLLAFGGGPGVVESDCLKAVQTILGTGRDSSGGWAFFQEARDLLRVFNNISIIKIDRVCNGVAHVLAQLGKSGFNGVLCDAGPPCVEELLTLDVT